MLYKVYITSSTSFLPRKCETLF